VDLSVARASDRPVTFVLALSTVVVLALALRLLCWVGPGARDDAQYMAYALDWVQGNYGFLGADSVFAARPAVYAPVAVSAAVAGGAWPDSASVFFLAMSLVHVIAVGGIGWRIGRREGLVAALIIAVFPLDVAFATQVMPDLPMAAWLALGVWMLTLPARPWTALLAGAAFGMAAATKEFAVVALALVPVLLPWADGLRAGLRTAALVSLGFAVPFAVEIAWFAVHGDPVAVLAAIVHNARAEKNGNPDVNYLFKIAFETFPPGPATRWFGGLGRAWLSSLPVLALAAAGALGSTLRSRRQAGFFVYWAVVFFVFVQYVGPFLAGRTIVERMERFLIPMGAPMALAVAMAVGAASRSRFRLARGASWAAVALLLLAMLRATVVHAFPNEIGLSSDWRAIAEHLDRAGIRSALMDRDAAFRVTVFSAGRVLGRVFPETNPLQDVPPAEWFVASANLTDHLRRANERIPQPWLEVARVPGPLLGALAGYDPVVYWTGPGAAMPSRRSADHDPQAGWLLRDVVDVGDPADEHAHGYRIVDARWEGRRVLHLHEGPSRWYADWGVTVEDDGRAFTGHQEFVLRGLDAGLPMRVVKRVDANVPQQVSRLYVDGQIAGEFRSGPRTAAFLELAVDVPGQLVTAGVATLREEFVASGGDVNVFRVRVYQRDGR
jgi:4-amino-4-deoxy-L-arabinose transferase-like glycosyltransferase